MRFFLCAGALALVAAGGVAAWRFRSPLRVALMKAGIAPQRTVDGVLREYGHRAEARFAPTCRARGVAWPPRRARLVAFKQERVIEVWLSGMDGAWFLAATYPVLGASGGPGPKRRQGDCQVPEGFYKLTVLNPNSRHHLSVRVDYPNAEDIAHRSVEESQMGGDIYVHGGSSSIGCLAIGDDAIEEVFCLLAQVRDREIWIAPCDLRRAAQPETGDAWLDGLYARLRRRLGGTAESRDLSEPNQAR